MGTALRDHCPELDCCLCAISTAWLRRVRCYPQALPVLVPDHFPNIQIHCFRTHPLLTLFAIGGLQHSSWHSDPSWTLRVLSWAPGIPVTLTRTPYLACLSQPKPCYQPFGPIWSLQGAEEGARKCMSCWSPCMSRLEGSSEHGLLCRPAPGSTITPWFR